MVINQTLSQRLLPDSALYDGIGRSLAVRKQASLGSFGPKTLIAPIHAIIREALHRDATFILKASPQPIFARNVTQDRAQLIVTDSHQIMQTKHSRRATCSLGRKRGSPAALYFDHIIILVPLDQLIES